MFQVRLGRLTRTETKWQAPARERVPGTKMRRVQGKARKVLEDEVPGTEWAKVHETNRAMLAHDLLTWLLLH